MVRAYCDKKIDVAPNVGTNLAVVGYRSQDRAQSPNLRDSETKVQFRKPSGLET
jgi:ketol-acid reductoisomerase